jgi:hypothetical protein
LESGLLRYLESSIRFRLNIAFRGKLDSSLFGVVAFQISLVFTIRHKPLLVQILLLSNPRRSSTSQFGSLFEKSRSFFDLEESLSAPVLQMEKVKDSQMHLQGLLRSVSGSFFKLLFIFVSTSTGFIFDPPAGFPKPPGFGKILIRASFSHTCTGRVTHLACSY